MAATHAPGPASPRTAAMPPPPPRDGSSPVMNGAPHKATVSAGHSDSGGSKKAKDVPINSVVERAKKLAGQMWVLLHAKACSNDECTVHGCAQTKALFRIMRAERKFGYKAPAVQHAAGVKAAKLLEHHRLCREARNAQGTTDEPHFCLVCSLVARARLQSGRDHNSDFKLDYSISPYDLDNPPTDQLALAPPANHSHNTRRRKRPRANTWDGPSTSRDAVPTSSRPKRTSMQTGSTHSRSRGGQRVRSNSESSEEGESYAPSSSSSSTATSRPPSVSRAALSKKRGAGPAVSGDMRLSEESLAAFKTLTQAAQLAESEEQRASLHHGASLLSTLGKSYSDDEYAYASEATDSSWLYAREAKRARAASWGGERTKYGGGAACTYASSSAHGSALDTSTIGSFGNFGKTIPESFSVEPPPPSSSSLSISLPSAVALAATTTVAASRSAAAAITAHNPSDGTSTDTLYFTPPLNPLEAPPIPEADSLALPTAATAAPDATERGDKTDSMDVSVEEGAASACHPSEDKIARPTANDATSSTIATPMEAAAAPSAPMTVGHAKGAINGLQPITPINASLEPLIEAVESKNRSSSLGGECRKPAVPRTPTSSGAQTQSSEEAVLSLMRLAEAVQAISPAQDNSVNSVTSTVPISNTINGPASAPTSGTASVASPTAIKAW